MERYVPRYIQFEPRSPSRPIGSSFLRTRALRTLFLALANSSPVMPSRTRSRKDAVRDVHDPGGVGRAAAKIAVEQARSIHRAEVHRGLLGQGLVHQLPVESRAVVVADDDAQQRGGEPSRVLRRDPRVHQADVLALEVGLVGPRLLLGAFEMATASGPPSCRGHGPEAASTTAQNRSQSKLPAQATTMLFGA